MDRFPSRDLYLLLDHASSALKAKMNLASEGAGAGAIVPSCRILVERHPPSCAAAYRKRAGEA
jgi:hypothetical protein